MVTVIDKTEPTANGIWVVTGTTEFRGSYKDFAYWLAPNAEMADTYKKALYQYYDGQIIGLCDATFIRENWFLMTDHYTSVMDFVKDFYGDMHPYWALEKLASEMQDAPLRLILEKVNVDLSNLTEINAELEEYFWQTKAKNCDIRGRIADRLLRKGYDVVFCERTITKINQMMRKWL